MTSPEEGSGRVETTDVNVEVDRPGGDSASFPAADADGGEDDRGPVEASPTPPSVTGAGDAGTADVAEEPESLLPSDDVERFRERWERLQADFVDRPRETVEAADDLVRDLVQELTAGFVQRRSNLERQWNEGDEASTEDLRVAFTHYRSFFNRLLST